jgi:protein-S-isoprenylcysteine O-methyltransferase Ste14
VTAPPEREPAPSHGDRRIARLLVLVQFILLGLIVLLPDADTWTLPVALGRAARVAEWVGIIVMVVAAAALGRGLTAAPLPNSHAKLRTGGLYRFVRHPIYTGLLLFAVASTTLSGSVWVVVASAALVLLINTKARWEERHLAQRFPEYAAYAARTHRFIPGPPR